MHMCACAHTHTPHTHHKSENTHTHKCAHTPHMQTPTHNIYITFLDCFKVGSTLVCPMITRIIFVIKFYAVQNSDKHTHTHTHTHTLSLSLSLSLTHTHTHTHTKSLFCTVLK